MSTENTLAIKTALWMPDNPTPLVKDFLSRPAFDGTAETSAGEILTDVKKNGDEAVARYIQQLDGADLAPKEFAVQRAELNAARDQVEAGFIAAAQEAHKRINSFAHASLKKDWSTFTPKGGTVGEQFAPMERVGLYIPGGQRPLASTALMTVTLAKAAGVPEIVACSPVDNSKRMNPYLLYALELAGATEIYKIGGIQAIGAMAYGTATIRKVVKIAGPGGTFVTAAKRNVYGHVALDLVAGPSEIAILADDSAQAEVVAADLLSQAEHGTGFEKALLVTPSSHLAQAVARELARQAEGLSHRAAIQRVLTEGTLIVIVNHLDAGMELCNRFAPEHLQIMVREPRLWLKKVRHAGAVFVGDWTPECVGDYVAGPSHVLPTGGTARMFSGLTTDDFRTRTSVVAYTRADLKNALPIIEAFGQVEGLDAHTHSARIRFEKA
ncbi:MAG: histidinol dehydrogenase [Lentisphaerae bacterium]|nr:histidinol dehydrogenase [Lentisphaerota bacterium]